MGSFLNYTKKKREEEEKNSSSSGTKLGSFGKYVAEKKIGLDTLESDLASLSETLSNVYSNWQDPDTMTKTKEALEKTYGRVNDYKSYVNSTSSDDLTDFNKRIDELLTGYQSTLDQWDGVAGTYSQFQNADAYSSAKKNYELTEKYKGLDYAGVQKAMEDSGDTDWLSQYGVNVGYSSLNDYNAELENLAKQITSASGSEKTALQEYYDKLEAKKNQYEIDHKFDLYKDVMQNEDFAEMSGYVENEGGGLFDWISDTTHRSINENADNEKSYWDQNIGERMDSLVSGLFGTVEGIEYMTDEERKVYNYLYNKEGKESAANYLKEMEVTFSKRKTDARNESVAEATNSLGAFSNTVASALSVPWGIVGNAASFVTDVNSKLLGMEYNPYSSAHTLSNTVDTIRDTTRENIENATADSGFNILGQNGAAFLYDTGLSMAESYLGAKGIGKGFETIMGMGAASSTAKDLYESGASEEDIAAASLLAGGAEMFFEHFELDNFLKIKNVDTLGKAIKSAIVQTGSEALGEMGTELTNVLTDWAVRGGVSDYSSMVEQFIYSGYTEEEAKKKAKTEIAKQIGLAGIGGALSGGIMGSVESAAQYGANNSIGKTISGNNQTDTLAEIARGTNNDAYGEYLKLIENGNASNAQIGNLYARVAEETDTSYQTEKKNAMMHTIANRANELGDSRNSGVIASAIQKRMNNESLSAEEKTALKSDTAKAIMQEIERGEISVERSGSFKDAYDNRAKVESVLTTPKSAEAVRVQKRVAEMNIGAETMDNESGQKIEVEGMRKDEDGNTVLQTSEGERLVSEVTLSDHAAEVVAMAEGMDSTKADTFVSLYTEGMDVEEYATAFELAFSYGKNGYGTENVLKYKGVLTEEQAVSAYETGMRSATEAKQKQIDEVTAKHFSGITPGTFDDSGIDYNKVNTQQRAAVRFTELLSKATGVNVVYFQSEADADGNWTAENGRYDANTNTIYLDVNAGITESNAKDLIVPTLSHELTHWMKDKAPAAYNKISGIAMDILSTDYRYSPDTLVAAEQHRHKRDYDRDVSEEYAQDELVARACEDMLANPEKIEKYLSQMDEKTAKTFSEKLREAFEKIKEWLADLLDAYKSNSEEAKIVRKYADKVNELQDAWFDAFDSAIKANQVRKESPAVSEEKVAASERVQFSMRENVVGVNGVLYPKVIVLDGKYNRVVKNPKDFATFVYNNLINYEIEVADKDGNIENIVFAKKNERVLKDGAKNPHRVVDKLAQANGSTKRVVIANLPEVIKNSEYVEEHLEQSHQWLDENGWEIRTCAVMLEGGDTVYPVYLSIGRTKDGRNVLYAVNVNIKEGVAIEKGATNNAAVEITTPTKKSISQTGKNATENSQFSDRDSNGNGLTKEQIEYFKDSKVRDENGNLLVVYHGTRKADFTVFNRNHNYFTDSKEMADSYSPNGEGFTGYLNITKPFIIDAQGERWSRVPIDAETKKLLEAAGGSVFKEGGKWRSTPADIVSAIEDGIEEGELDYDGVIIRNVDDTGSHWEGSDNTVANDYIVFNSNQFKNMDNTSPTSDKDIRYSDRDSEGTGLTKGQIEYFKNSKVRDSAGNLKVMYHGTENASFTVFNPEYSDDGISLFFTDSKTVAKGYSGTTEEYIPGKKYSAKELTQIINDSYYYVTEEDGQYHIIHNNYGELEKEYTTDTLEEMQEYVLEEYGSTGAGNYKVYLNIENPYIMEANHKAWDELAEVNPKTMTQYEYIYATKGADGTYNVEWLDTNNQYGESETEYDMSISDIDKKFGSYVSKQIAAGHTDLSDVVVDKKTHEIIPNNTRQLAEYAKERGYDGVIINNLVDTAIYAAGNEKFESATIAIAFSSEQVKSVANENPTQDADIRYSDRNTESIYDAVGELNRLRKENEKLKQDVERLRQRNKLERTVTGGAVLNENQIDSVAAYLLRNADSTYSKEQLAKELKEIYKYLQSEDVTWDTLMLKATDAASRIVAEKRERTVPNDYAKEILYVLRNTKVSLNEVQKAEAKYAYGKDWYKMYFGRVLVTNDGIPLDSMWQEWAQMYPDVFDADMTDADMATAVLDAYDAVKASSEIVEAYDRAEMEREIAIEIYNQFWNVSPVRTLADKYERELANVKHEKNKAFYEKKLALAQKYDTAVKQLKYEHRVEMKDMKAKYNQRKTDAVYQTKERYQKTIKELRTKRAEEIRQIKEKSREYNKAYRDRLARKAEIDKITKKALKLNTWLVKNSKEAHVPEILKKPVAAVLQSLNFSSERLLGMRGGEQAGEPTNKDISLSKAFESLADMVDSVNDAQVNDKELDGMYGHLDLPTDFVDFVRKTSTEINDLLRAVGDNEYILNQMSMEQLKDVNNILTVLTHTVTQTNKALAAAHGKSIASLAQDTMVYADTQGKHSKLVGGVTDFFNFSNALPYYAFKRFGEGGRRIFEAFQDGWDKFAFNVKQIIDYSNKTYTAKEVQEWAEQVHEFDVLNGKEKVHVKMTTAQIMSLYCLQKREQAKGHLSGGGIRVADFKEGKGKVSQPDGVTLQDGDISNIISKLTARQIEVADRLQEFMNTVCTDWGNDVSMVRFGYKAFGEENYFPITSDTNNLAQDDAKEQENSLFRLLNMSFTKGTIQKANNRVVIDNIFDIFASHTSDMAKYNALALPVLDAFKWYNYKEKIKVNPEDKNDRRFKTKGVKQSMEKAYGAGAKKYVVQFLRDINGANSGGIEGAEQLAKKLMSNYKVASVGANLRVAVLQPTSFIRASVLMDAKYLTKAFAKKPQIEKAKSTCGIALWKSLGFYDTNISKGVAEQIKHEDTALDKAKEYSMKLAEWGDSITWGYLYNACEAEVSDKQPGLTGKAKDEAVAKRLREVIYSTQVVDSTMTRTQMMRNKSTWVQMATSFMSEPMISYNLLHDCYMQYNADMRITGNKGTALKRNGKKIARAMLAYTLTTFASAIAGAIPDTLRDDDEEKELAETFFTNAADNAVSDALGMIPLFKDVVSLFQGYDVTRMDTQALASVVRAYQSVTKAVENGEFSYKTVYTVMRAVSQATGIPVSNLMRDAVAIWNNTIGENYESLKLK